jgi:hypothetical protein
MRTSIFTSFTQLPKEFREDFNTLWNLPAAQRTALIPYVSEISKIELSKEREELMNKAVSEIGGDIPDLLRVLKLLHFISSEWNPFWDTPENFLKDIGELKLIPSEKAQESKSFLLEFLSEIKKDNLRRLRKIYANSLLPSLESIKTLIDFRAVFENPFHLGDKIKDYEPRCIGFVPVILVRISRDSGNPKNFEFQCEQNDLQLIISQLQATLKDLENGKMSIPGGSE